ncbi:MAG: histidine phosphatase family protein [Actinomycetota bacterium]
MSQLLLVRHGQTDANAAGLLLGRTDPPLNEAGRAQAAAVAERVAAFLPERVLTSPLRRTVETAEVVATRCGVGLAVEPRLIEVDYGEYDGLPFAELPTDLVRRWRTEPDFAPPGGESLASVGVRMAALGAEVLADLGAAPVVAVSHVSPIKAAVCWALGLPDLASWRMRLDNASVTRLAPGPEGPVLLSFNER